MFRRSFFHLGSIAFLLAVGPVCADTSLQLGKLELTAQNADVIVTHKHDVKVLNSSRGTLSSNTVVLEMSSTLRIVRKSDGKEVSVQAVMPLTALVHIDNSKYFAGLSTLKTLSYKYNFILFTEDGRIVTTALITKESGQCRTVDESVTNFIGWFDRDAPDVELDLKDGQVTKVIVENPYDRAPDDTEGECVIPVANDE